MKFFSHKKYPEHKKVNYINREGRVISINRFELKLLKFLQEKHDFNILEGVTVFSKSPATLKRNIENINSYLPYEKKFYIDKNNVKNNMTYTDTLNFIKSLSMNDYSVSQEERVDLLILSLIFIDPLNKTKLYHDTGISNATIKKDTKILKDILRKKNLDIEIVPKKGITINGSEQDLRILSSKKLMNVLELDETNILVARESNTPLERKVVNSLLKHSEIYIKGAGEILKILTAEGSFNLSYNSKKFITIYLTIALFRREKNKNINLVDGYLDCCKYQLLMDSREDEFLGVVLSSLDYTKSDLTTYDPTLLKLVENFIQDVQKNLITKLFKYDMLVEEIYKYTYRSIQRQKLGYEIFDDKLEDTHLIFENLFNLTRENLYKIESEYSISMSYAQIAGITLILKKFITISKVAGRNKKRILIVTNSSPEKIEFFTEILKLHLDIKIIGSININELHLLGELEYDNIITFSNRIKTLLLKKGASCLKLPFHLEPKDINNLLKKGFSRSQRKLISEEIAAEVAKKDAKEIANLLKTKYSDYFI